MAQSFLINFIQILHISKLLCFTAHGFMNAYRKLSLHMQGKRHFYGDNSTGNLLKWLPVRKFSGCTNFMRKAKSPSFKWLRKSGKAFRAENLFSSDDIFPFHPHIHPHIFILQQKTCKKSCNLLSQIYLVLKFQILLRYFHCFGHVKICGLEIYN